jgi:ankyrin repeat protein
MKTKLLVAILIVGTMIPGVVLSQANTDQTVEEKAWQEVDSLNKQSLEEFLKKFPSGRTAEMAKMAIEFQNTIAAIKHNEAEPDVTIPFSALGQRWQEWQNRRPQKGAIGYSQSGSGALGWWRPYPIDGGKTPGLGSMSFDSQGALICPTGDGSIIAFRTEGNAFDFLNGVKIQMSGSEPNYFAVIADKGLVHLTGTVKVTGRRSILWLLTGFAGLLALVILLLSKSKSKMRWSTTIALVALTWSSIAYCGEIHDASKSGDLERVKALLKDNPKLVSSKDDHSATPLLWAANKGHKDVVQVLLDYKADVNATDGDGHSALHYAVFNDHLDVAVLLLANKADVKAKTSVGETPLHVAAGSGHKDMAELLLTNKADVAAKSNTGLTPLHLAASNGHTDVAEVLLGKKAEVNAKDNDGDTPLHLAAAHGFKNVAELLLTNKADINATDSAGETPLHYAIIRKHNDVAEFLRQHGGNE